MRSLASAKTANDSFMPYTHWAYGANNYIFIFQSAVDV